jgi:hypothetical protein
MTETMIAPSYATWDNQLTGRCQSQRKVSNNTWLLREDNGSISMKLHATKIVTVDQDGKITLNSGGWRTPTTKGRINDALRDLLHDKAPGISQVDGIWLIYPHGDYDAKLTFADGMWVMPDGSMAGSGPDVKVLKQGVKLIRAYMKPVAQMIADGKFPKPSNGDPWNFLMVSTDGELALAGSEADTRLHLVQYMREKYYFGSLLLRAMEKKLGLKYGDTDTLRKMVSGELHRSEWRGFISVSPICLHCFACVMNGEPPEGYVGGIGATQLAGILDEYLKFWFNLAPN